jgi:sec-independent protein translocase protein TatA
MPGDAGGQVREEGELPMLAIFGLGPPEIIGILVLLLLLFGAKRLPELARSLGQGVKEFRKSVKDMSEDTDESDSSPPGESS